MQGAEVREIYMAVRRDVQLRMRARDDWRRELLRVESVLDLRSASYQL
jgi:hypothetical protein